MSESTRVTEMFDNVWASYGRLFESMSDDDWRIQSLCPDWTAHQAVAHVFGVESMLSQWMPATAEDPVPIRLVTDFMKKSADLPGDELAAECQRLMGVRRQQIAALDDAVFSQPCLTPVGPADYGRFMDIRVFDFWVHERDVRIPLGRPAESEDGPAAVRSVDEVALSIGYIAGKKIGLPDGKSLSFRLTGPVERTINVMVDGRAKPVDSLEHADAVVTTDSTTFVMLACGRIDPGEQITAGNISWTGDDELGDRAARNLAFTM